MSRWSAERLRVGLAPERVELARLAWWPGRPPRRQCSLPCTPKPGEPPWQAALEAIDAPLAEIGRRGEAVAVVLSNHWVRYLVLPWQAELTSTAELDRLARLRFEQTYGAAATGWAVRVGDGGWGAAQVACAVDAALVDALRTRLAAHGLRLASLQPLLMAAFNDTRRELAKDGALAVVEPGRVCVGVRAQRRWVEIASRRAGGDPAGTIEQELATLGAADAASPLDVVLVGEPAGWSAPASRQARLLGRPGAVRSLALCGAG